MNVPPSKTKGNAIIYARVASSEPGAEVALQAQVTKLEDSALANGMEGVGIFTDQGSGLSEFALREGGAALLASLGETKVDEVYCTDLYRISRSVVDVLGVIKTLQEQGVALRVPGIDDPLGLEGAIILLLAEQDRSQVLERMRLGRERRKDEGSAS